MALAGRCGASTHSTGMASGSVFRSVRSGSAKQSCKYFCRDRRLNCLANVGRFSSELPAPAIALVTLAFATKSWIVFAIMPIFALTGIGTPALQALSTRQVDPAQQGQFQGVLASAVSLASIAAPLAFSTFYFAVQKQWPGAIWLSVVLIYAISIPLVFLGTGSVRPAQPASAWCKSR